MTPSRIRSGEPRPYSIRLDGKRHRPEVVQAILMIASEYPGDRPIAFLVGQRMIRVDAIRVDPTADGFLPAIRRAIAAYAA